VLPKVDSFSDKAGYRHEWGTRTPKPWDFLKFDAGSYAEGGLEFSLQNNVLSSVTLANGATTVMCSATAQSDISSCFKAFKSTFPIGPMTSVVGQPASKTLHTPGAYWDFHLSRTLDMGVLKNMKNKFAVTTDSAGEVFFGRPASAVLSTQTNYAVPWSVALTIPVWGNLTVAPTFNAFFYRPQLSDIHEQINTFTISLRWYGARDERVPLARIPFLSGPTSADQTKSSGKSK
jgi:hypothetical protein